MRILTHGCSHTYGDDLEDRNLSWPVQLSDRMNAELDNLSCSGCSNQRIVHETVKVTADQHYDLVVIAWSHFERFSRCRNDNRHIVDFNPGTVQHALYKNTPEYEDYAKLHYTYWSDSVYQFEQWIQQILFLQSWFKQNQIPYVMLNGAYNYYDKFICHRDQFNKNIQPFTCFDQINDQQLDCMHKELQQLTSCIDLCYYYQINSFAITDLHQTHAVGPTNHLLEQGHTEVAELVYTYAKNQ